MDLIQLTAKSKEHFLDRPAIMRFLDEAESKAFNKIGGRIRLTAMRSMRAQKRPKKKAFVPTPSAPGQPPRRRVSLGSGLTKIYYTYNVSEHQVQIGPVKFGWSAYPNVTVPQLHEFGGSVQITEVDFGRYSPVWIRVGNRGRNDNKDRPTRTRRANYPKRPFMFPALEKNLQFIRDSWAGASVSVGS
jgi:hypothetical protein